MSVTDQDSPAQLAPRTRGGQSALTAFCVLVVQSFQRLWRVRQMGFVAVGLLFMVVVWVGFITHRPAGWGLPERRIARGTSHREYANELDALKVPPLPMGGEGIMLAVIGPFQATVRPTQVEPDAEPRFVFSNFLDRWAFMNYTRWVMLGAFLGFVLPLFTLSYASAAFGTERESRSLVWLMTRPLPRSLIYLAKFLGTLPWCLAFGMGGFVALCLVSAEHGERALRLYWPAAVGATIAFAALFHLIGAVFRRPVVVGLIYVFFYEALVAMLPGSLKLLSLTFYARCLMYNAASGYPVEMLNVPEAEPPTTAWLCLGAVAVGFTALGMWLFSRSEYRDDV